MKLSLKMKFLIPTVTATIICLMAISLVSYMKSKSALEAVINEDLDHVSASLSNQVGDWIAEREGDLTDLSRDDLFQKAADAAKGSPESEDAGRRLKRVTDGNPLFEMIAIAGVDGNFCASSTLEQVGRINVSDRSYFKQSMSGSIAVSDVIQSKASGNPIFVISVPIKEDNANAVKGILLGAVLLDQFSQKFIDAKTIGKTGYVYVVNREGTVVAHPDKTEVLRTRINDFDFGKRIVEQKNGRIQYAYGGVEKSVAFSQEKRTGWIIASTANTDEMFAPVRRIRDATLLIGAVGIVFIAAVLILLTRSIVNPINEVIRGMEEGAGQVASVAGQVSSSSQSMAEGASQQAAAIEETSSSMEEMAAMTRSNAQRSESANDLMGTATLVVSRANDSMGQLTRSMADITKASEETSRIIKTIDEIAFQTNLLALNAAVEAARAGEAGAGFAVVADEVRNLALRAADAARDTAVLIEGTMKQVNQGAGLVFETSEAFQQVAASTREVGELLAQISRASSEQSQGIGQVNGAIAEMDKVVQQNASNAEESASASEEMSAQAEQLRDFVNALVIIVKGRVKDNGAKVGPVRPVPGIAPRAAQTKRPRIATAGEIRPDQVIPFEGDKAFKDF